MTMPSLIAKHRAKVLETSFKKCVSNLYQAYNLTRLELGIDNIYQTYIIWRDDGSDYSVTSREFINTFEQQLKVVDKYTKDFYPVKNYNGTKTIESNSGQDYPAANTILADGSSYSMHVNSDGNRVGFHIFIDTNGPYKGPNRYGYDIFKFYIGRDNKLVPVQMNKLYSDEELENALHPDLAGYPCSVKSSQASNGAGCSYYAMNNINPDNPEKKYWENLP